jgi:hypothetical protein
LALEESLAYSYKEQAKMVRDKIKKKELQEKGLKLFLQLI